MHCNKVLFQQLIDSFDNNLENNFENNACIASHNNACILQSSLSLSLAASHLFVALHILVKGGKMVKSKNIMRPT